MCVSSATNIPEGMDGMGRIGQTRQPKRLQEAQVHQHSVSKPIMGMVPCGNIFVRSQNRHDKTWPRRLGAGGAHL